MISAIESLERVIVGDEPFGLVDKDAKFAKLDAKKAFARWGDTSPGVVRKANLFGGTSPEDLLARMEQLHTGIAVMEADGLNRPQILQALLTEDPDIKDFDLLFKKTPWGERLVNALHRETYLTDESGVLWTDFVMSRVRRTLGGVFVKAPRYDDRFSYQIRTPQDILRFDPESNAHENDGPQFHIRGNKIKMDQSGVDTDQRFGIDVQNVGGIEVCEADSRIEVFKDLGQYEFHLMYQKKPIGSTDQLEIELIAKKPTRT